MSTQTDVKATTSIDRYIRSLNYDPKVILSVVPDGTTSTQPVPAREQGNNGIIISTTIRHSLKKNLDEVAILNPSVGVVFPGALIAADSQLVDGHPTPISLPRNRTRLTLDLPGLKHPSEEVEPNFSSFQEFLNAKLEEWNKTPASKGYKNAARSYFQLTKAYTKQQVALSLGFNAEWAEGNASAQIDVKSTKESSAVVAYYKQVFYTVTMDTPTAPSSVFAKEVSEEDVKMLCTNGHPPAYVRNVDYGRILLVKMESSAINSSVKLKGAFEQATSAGVTVGGDLAATYKEIIKNSTFTVLAIGGDPGAPGKVLKEQFSGASDEKIKGLQQYLAKYMVYSRDNPGVPIAYTVAFLKDHQFARMGFATDYTEVESVRYNNGYVKVHHDGVYVAKFEVTWNEPDKSQIYNVSRKWESGEKTAGYTQQVDLPGDAHDVRIRAWAATGLVWDPWGEIMNVYLNGPDNKTYRVYGTTLDRKWNS